MIAYCQQGQTKGIYTEGIRMAEITKKQMHERLGNIDQIRDLLFGHKMREYEQRLEKCDRSLEKVESEFSNFQSEVRDRLTQLQDSLSTEIRSAVDSLEKKLKYVSLTTQEETSALQQEIDGLFKNGNKLEEDILSLREQVFEELEKSFSNLNDAKISRGELSQFLFELCLKIKRTDFLPDIKEAAENQLQAEIVGPEEEQQEQHN